MNLGPFTEKHLFKCSSKHIGIKLGARDDIDSISHLHERLLGVHTMPKPVSATG